MKQRGAGNEDYNKPGMIANYISNGVDNELIKEYSPYLKPDGIEILFAYFLDGMTERNLARILLANDNFRQIARVGLGVGLGAGALATGGTSAAVAMLAPKIAHKLWKAKVENPGKSKELSDLDVSNPQKTKGALKNITLIDDIDEEEGIIQTINELYEDAEEYDTSSALKLSLIHI